MIQVGGIDATRIDLEVPAAAGLLQTIGDTTGVGGVFRGLRTFPVLSGIAADMLDLCPDAWFLNYTNPMAMNVWWMSVVAPEIKTVGLCHSVYWTVHDLCELIGVPMEGTHYRAAGVNQRLRPHARMQRLGCAPTAGWHAWQHHWWHRVASCSSPRAAITLRWRRGAHRSSSACIARGARAAFCSPAAPARTIRCIRICRRRHI